MKKQKFVHRSVGIALTMASIFSGSQSSAFELDYGFGENEVNPSSEAVSVEGETPSCVPAGNVVYRKASVEPETNEPLPGRLEGLVSASLSEHTLTVVTRSGEKISYPFSTRYWAKIAYEQICTDSQSFLDLSDCKFNTDAVLFLDYACFSSAARNKAYADAPAGIQWLGTQLDPELQSLRIDSLKYACSRSWFFFDHYRENGKDLILRRLPADAQQTYRIFPRAAAKQHAVDRVRETGQASAGLVSVQKLDCQDATVVPGLYIH